MATSTGARDLPSGIAVVLKRQGRYPEAIHEFQCEQIGSDTALAFNVHWKSKIEKQHVFKLAKHEELVAEVSGFENLTRLFALSLSLPTHLLTHLSTYLPI